MAGNYPRPFGKYVLVRPLSSGAHGDLTLAVSADVGGFEKLCVVQQVIPTAENADLVQRLIEDAKVAARLNHSSLVQILDAGTFNGHYYLAMEYIEGRNLREVLARCAERNQRLPLAAALHVARQVCRALNYAHNYGSGGLAHRELCPSNVFVSYFGEVKVAEFGIATAIRQLRGMPARPYGRLGYLTPERLRAEDLDGRADIYALGIMLWEMMVGQPMRPAIHDTGHALSLVNELQFVPPSARDAGLPRSLDQVVARALRANRERRYPDPATLRDALGTALAQIDPTFDASKLAEVLSTLFRPQIEEARREREKLLSTDYHALRRPTGPPDGRRVDGEQGDAQMIGERYRVVRLLGEGGMGAVYEAEHVEIGRRVAIKVLHAAFSRDPEALTRFREEARAATRIGHPNIVQVTDSGITADGRLFFVMELLAGVDLATVMAEQRILPLGRSLNITLQICEALAAAHDAGIVHRDLKPENVFLSFRDGRPDFVTIVDFGVAKNLELAREGAARLTSPGRAMGTPEYMAPEQAAGSEIDHRIDVYATTTLLYEMLTGHLPHEAQNLMQLLTMKAAEPPVSPERYREDLPPRLTEVLLRGLHADADRRYQNMRELADALKPFADAPAVALDETVPSTRLALESAPSGIAARSTADAGPPSRRRWVKAALAGALLAAASAPLLWFLIRDEPAARPKAVRPPADAAPEPQVVKQPAQRDPPRRPPPRAKMTPEEVERLLEWAKRAAAGGRFARPPGDNVRDLLARIEADYPDHPQVTALRQRLTRRLRAQGRRAARRKRYARAERFYRAWLGLAPGSGPRRALAGLALQQARQALRRRQYPTAIRRAREALEFQPTSVAAHELLGDIAVRRKRHAPAAKHYRNALRHVGPKQRRLRRRLQAKLSRSRRKSR